MVNLVSLWCSLHFFKYITFERLDGHNFHIGAVNIL